MAASNFPCHELAMLRAVLRNSECGVGGVPLRDAARVLTCLHPSLPIRAGPLRGYSSNGPRPTAGLLYHSAHASTTCKQLGFQMQLACKAPDRHIVRPPKEDRASPRNQLRVAWVGLSVSSVNVVGKSYTTVNNSPRKPGLPVQLRKPAC